MTEYSWETREQAEELYVLERLTFEQVATATGVSVSQLKRWSAEAVPSWTDRRRELREALSSIKRDTILAKAKLIKAVLDTGDAQQAYAFSSLEAATRAAAKVAEQYQASAPGPAAEIREIKTPADAVAAIDEAVQAKVNRMLASPGGLSSEAIKDLQRVLETMEKLKAKYLAEGDGGGGKGISEGALKSIRDALGMSE